MDHNQNRRPQRSSSSTGRTHNRLEFFKVFLPNFSSNQLLIPPDFVKQLKSRRTTIPKKAILKDRNGQEWNVHLMEEADRLFIKTGWQDFVNSCSLEFGDFLIFRYFRKKLIFTVKVFSRNGCLKEDVASEAFNNRERPEPDIDKNRDVVELGSDDEEEEEEEERVSQRRRSRPMRVCKRKFSDLNLDNLKKSSTSSFKRQIGLLQPLVNTLKETASAKCIVPKHPHFVVVTSKNITKLLFIPSSFLKSHNIQMKPQVKLHDEKGRQWPIKIEMLYESQRVTVTSGWSEFVNKNLKLGDYCVLEFVLEQQNRCGEIHVQICGADLKTERRNRYSVVVP